MRVQLRYVSQKTDRTILCESVVLLWRRGLGGDVERVVLAHLVRRYCGGRPRARQPRPKVEHSNDFKHAFRMNVSIIVYLFQHQTRPLRTIFTALQLVQLFSTLLYSRDLRARLAKRPGVDTIISVLARLVSLLLSAGP